MDLRETGIDEANWIQLAQDRVQHDGEPSGSIKKVGFFDKLSDVQFFQIISCTME
jgi:hypothetical protein